MHVQFPTAKTAAQQPGQEHLAFAHRTFHDGAALAHGIVSNHLLIALELLPVDVALVVVLDEHVAFVDRPTDAAPHALAAVLNAHLARGSTEGIGAAVDRVGQNVVHGIVSWQSLDYAVRLGIVCLDRQLDAFVPEPDMNLACTVELSELREQKIQCTLHALIWVFLDPVPAHLHVATATRGKREPRLAFWRSASCERCRNSDNSSSLIVPFIPSSSRSLG